MIHSSQPSPQAIESLSAHLVKTFSSSLQTPARLFLNDVLEARITELKTLSQSLSQRFGVEVSIAYSVKTNPNKHILKAVINAGFGAETISLSEAARCAASGINQDKLVLTGPGKWWRGSYTNCPESFNAIHCDSVNDAKEVLRQIVAGKTRAKVVGFRIAPQDEISRFGIPAKDTQGINELSRLATEFTSMGIELGLHMHVDSRSMELTHWAEEIKHGVNTLTKIATVSKCPLVLVDVGGGWAHTTSINDLESIISSVIDSTIRHVPTVQRFVLEPGRFLVQSSTVVLARVLQVRPLSQGGTAAIVDCSVADLPTRRMPNRAVAFFDSTSYELKILDTGADALLGRLCMERDVVRDRIKLPPTVEPGDLVVFFDAGAYDTSMSYSFGE